VVRTDRTLVFYEKQENLSKLWDILAVYAWIDKEVGYGQGQYNTTNPLNVTYLAYFLQKPVLYLYQSLIFHFVTIFKWLVKIRS
jgi:hypothetical protein